MKLSRKPLDNFLFSQFLLSNSRKTNLLQRNKTISAKLTMKKQEPELVGLVSSNDLVSSDAKASRSSETDSLSRLLPDTFVPQECHVICGRGKKVFDHPGNFNYRCMVLDRVEAYKAAPTKAQKSAVVSSVFDDVTKNGAFVKEETATGRWHVVDDQAVREKISQFFRDCLTDRYKSSKKVVAAKRHKRVSLDNSMLPDLANSWHEPNVASAPKKRRVSFSEPNRACRRTSTDAFRELLQFSQKVLSGSDESLLLSTPKLPSLADSRKQLLSFLEADVPDSSDAISWNQDDETIAPDSLSVVDTEMVFSPKACFACVH